MANTAEKQVTIFNKKVTLNLQAEKIRGVL
jgi:hypothetical protein